MILLGDFCTLPWYKRVQKVVQKVIYPEFYPPIWVQKVQKGVTPALAISSG